MSQFTEWTHKQAFLLPPDLRDWIPQDDLVHFVLGAVERVDMNRFGSTPGERGTINIIRG
jgi:hypothetical protein